MQVVITPQPDGASAAFHVETDTVDGERELADHVAQLLDTEGVESLVITRYDE